MKDAFIILIGILLLCSCKDKDGEQDSRMGVLDVDVRYTGDASQWKLDSIKIEFYRINTDNSEQASYWIDKTGKQKFELPFGKYELKLKGDHCRTYDLESPKNIVTINPGESTQKAILIEYLNYSVIIKEMGKEMKEGDTIELDQLTALDIENKYSKKELHWKAETSTNSWLKFKKDTGTILGHKTGYVLLEIDDNNKNFKYDIWNYEKVIITTEDNGTFSIYVGAFKQSDVINYYPLYIAKIGVQYQDISKAIDHNSAVNLCAQSGKGWRLPTIGELSSIYIHKDTIGGFTRNGNYWSSSKRSEYYYYYYTFDFVGEPWYAMPSESFCVRCVRDL